MNTAPSSTRSFAPVRLLVDLNFAAKIWFGLFLFMAFCEAATLVLLLRPRRAEERQVVFIASNGRGYGGNETELSALTNLHVRVAEDVTQAFLNRNPRDFDQPERITLLFQPEVARRARADCDRETPERQLSAFEERRRLQLALEELPADQREVVLLRLEQELSLEQIGQITGVGRETVKSRLRYAIDKLRLRLKP